MKEIFKVYGHYLLETLLWACIALSLYTLLDPSGGASIREVFYNADALFPAMLYRDLVVDKAAAAGWIVPPSLQLFPDMLVYFAQAAFLPNTGARQVAYAILQYVLLTGANLVFVSVVFADDEPRKRIARILVLMGALALLVGAVSLDINQGYLIAFLCAHHVSPWINTLLCGTILLHRRLLASIPGLVFLFAVICLAIVSDPLFTGIFAPGVFLLVIFRDDISRRRKFAVLFLILTAVLVGFRLQRVLRGALPMLVINYEITTQLGNAARAMTFATAAKGISGTLDYLTRYIPWITWITAGGVLLLLPAVRFFSIPTAQVRRGLGFLALAMLSNLTMVFLTAILINLRAVRYLPALFFAVLPGLGFAAVFFRPAEGKSQRPPERTRYRWAAGIFVSIVACMIIFTLVATTRRSVPRPPLVQCLDKHGDQLKSGYGDYWNASPVNLYSRRGIRIHQVSGDLRPVFRANSFLWYAKEAPPNFIITDRMDVNLIRRRFGPPTSILRCGSSRVFIYKKRGAGRLRKHHAAMVNEIRIWRIIADR